MLGRTISAVTNVEGLDEFEQKLRVERALIAQRRARIMAVLATVAIVTTTATFYFTDAYQGLSLDPRPCEPAEIEGLARDGWVVETVDVPDATLTGLVRVPAQADAPWLLYFGANIDHSLRTARAYAELLLGRGNAYGAASFAYRGFDTSTGVSTPGKFQADARAVFDHLVRAHGVSADKLHVVGLSLGANAAALLGQDLAKSQYRLASTTLLSPGIAPYRLPPELYPLVLGAWEMPSKLAAMRGPVLLVSATDDEAYPPKLHARKMPALLGDRLVRHLEVTGGHEAPLRDERSLAAIRELMGVDSAAKPPEAKGKSR